MPTEREIHLKYHGEGPEGRGSIYDLLTLFKHVSKCEKCRRLWQEMELHAGMVEQP